MVQKLIYVLIYAGSALMVYNIYGFISFVRYIRGLNSKDNENQFLYLPIILLVGFLAGYLMVGFFGKPDFIVAGILFGGSVFVYLIYRYLWRVTQWVIDNNKLNAELQAERQYHEAKSDFLGSMSHEMRTPVIWDQSAASTQQNATSQAHGLTRQQSYYSPFFGSSCGFFSAAMNSSAYHTALS